MTHFIRVFEYGIWVNSSTLTLGFASRPNSSLEFEIWILILIYILKMNGFRHTYIIMQ